MKKEVVLIRHGETDWNAQLRWQGHTDIPLNANGIRQAESVAEQLQDARLQVLFSSDLARAHQTSEIISARLDLPVFTSDRLREVHVGAAEGLSYDETFIRFGQRSIERWRSMHPADWSFAFPNGETKGEARARVQQAIPEFLHSTGAKRVAVVSHGMLIRIFLHHHFPQMEMPSVLVNCGCVPLIYTASLKDWTVRDDCTLSLADSLAGGRPDGMGQAEG
jgi:broad specificity phosphatase PhoE